MEALNYSTSADVINIINKTAMFAGIGHEEQCSLANKSAIVSYPADSLVIQQNEAGDKLYIIMKGRVDVSIKTALQGTIHIATLSVGEVFGEIAILHSMPRSACIKTETDCVFLTISGQDFLKVYQHFPPKSRDNIQLVIAKRLAQIARWKYLI